MDMDLGAIVPGQSLEALLNSLSLGFLLYRVSSGSAVSLPLWGSRAVWV
jgi:hypothetical protein